MGSPLSFTQAFPIASDTPVLATLSRLMTVLDAIVLPLVDSKADYDAAVLSFRAILAERFATDIQPLFDSITSSASLGALFTTTSSTSLTVGLGHVEFVIGAGDRLKFAPMSFIAAVAADDPTIVMLGALVDFDRDTGTLTLDIASVAGLGATKAAWLLLPSPPPYVPVGVNAGCVDGASPQSGTSYTTRSDAGYDGVTLISDADATVTSATRTLAYASITATRKVQLPHVAGMNAGQRIRICDLSGALTSARTLAITPSGSEKIAGLGVLALTQPFQSAELEATASGWIVVSVYPPFPGAASAGFNAGQA